jgi:hypothetical protein
MFDIAGAKKRHQSAESRARVTLELMEIQNVPHQTINLRIRIPGQRRWCSWYGISTRRSRAIKANATLATPGGKPRTRRRHAFHSDS